MSRGEIWWVEHPETGRRPYLVLTRETAVPVVERVIAIPATRTIRGISSEVLLDGDDGMPEPCALTFDDIAAVSKSLFIERITRLGVERMTQVCRALAIATGC